MNYAAAEPLYRRALAGYSKNCGIHHPSTLRAAFNLALLLGDLGKHGESEAMHRSSFAGRKRVLGMDHVETLQSLVSLACLFRTTNRLAKAVMLLSSHAAKSPAVLAGVRYNLACYECLGGNHDEARRLIAAEIAARPAAREQALQDADLAPLHDFIRALPAGTADQPGAG
jgi:hypothetical protein